MRGEVFVAIAVLFLMVDAAHRELSHALLAIVASAGAYSIASILRKKGDMQLFPAWTLRIRQIAIPVAKVLLVILSTILSFYLLRIMVVSEPRVVLGKLFNLTTWSLLIIGVALSTAPLIVLGIRKLFKGSASGA